MKILMLPFGDGLHTEKCEVVIGSNSYFNGDVTLILSENNRRIHIGNSCLFAHGITINASDFHCVFDRKTDERINYLGDVVIGNNVWVCANVHFLKNSSISDGSVVGAHSIVSWAFDEKNIAIAGNPAKIIKHDILWRK